MYFVIHHGTTLTLTEQLKKSRHLGFWENGHIFLPRPLANRLGVKEKKDEAT